MGVTEQVFTALQVPCAPGRDDADVRVERVAGQFEADLVVALAGGAVGDRVRAFLLGDLDHAAGDEGPGERGPEQVVTFVGRAAAQYRARSEERRVGSGCAVR